MTDAVSGATKIECPFCGSKDCDGFSCAKKTQNTAVLSWTKGKTT